MSRYSLRHVGVAILWLLGAAVDGSLGADPLSTTGSDSQGQPQDYFYVSSQGDDNWSGTLPAARPDGSDGPLATLEGAQQLIRQRNSQEESRNSVTVMVLDGTYRMSRPLVLDSRDTGNGTQPFTIIAYPGHQPVLSGSRPVAGWKPYKKNILQCHLPRLNNRPWIFRQLFEV